MHRASIVVVAVLVAVASTGGIVAAASDAGGMVADGGATVSAPAPDAGVAATAGQDACDFPVDVEDGGGTTVSLDEEPEDVVVLAPNNAQHMWEIGAKDKVVGMPVNAFTAYLDGSEERTNVVDDQGFPVPEEVIALEPDLVIAANIISEDTITQLRDAGLTVYHSPLLTSVEDMYTEVETVGQLVGECEGATQTVEETRAQITEIENAVADEESPTVFYNLGFPFTVGEGTLEHELITKAGGENIALEANSSGYFQISEEVIVENDPEWIVTSEALGVPDSTAIQESTAVEQDQIIEINSNFISQHGPRNVIPLEQMATAFHPEAIAALEETPTPTPEPTPTATPTPESTPDPTPTSTPTATPTATDTPDADDDGAGFVAGAALLAILTVGVLARYRD